MNLKYPTVLLVLLLILPLSLNFGSPAKAETTQASPNLYFGVDVAFGNLAATEQLIDNVSSYTNFFLIGCTGGYNYTRLNIICQYVYDKGMSFIIYTDDPRYPTSQWLAAAKSTYGSSFLGLYYDDEPGGRQLDQADYPIIPARYIDVAKENYSEVGNMYVNYLNQVLRNGSFAITGGFANPTEFHLFTSDYALYWFDYEAGYDTVFAEFAMNYSRQLNIDLIRGAATVQNKSWGVMIDWTYTEPPYMENSTDLYNDMTLAYNSGAKYIIVFDSDKNWTQNVLTQAQLNSMKQFWQYVQANPRNITSASDRTAYVLPEDYGYGFRGPQDRIWGLWSNDSLTYNILDGLSMVMQKYGSNLDIIYPDGNQSVESEYSHIVNWDETPTTSAPPQNVLSLLFSTNAVYIYSIAASIIAAVAVATSVLKFRKEHDQKLHFRK
jgi:hypothetical protein